MSVKPSSPARPAASVKVATLLSEYVPLASGLRYLSTVDGSRPASCSASSRARALAPTTRHHSSGLAWVPPPVVTQPCPYRAARRSERGPLAATTKGTRGCCTQPGVPRESTAV